MRRPTSRLHAALLSEQGLRGECMQHCLASKAYVEEVEVIQKLHQGGPQQFQHLHMKPPEVPGCTWCEPLVEGR